MKQGMSPEEGSQFYVNTPCGSPQDGSAGEGKELTAKHEELSSIPKTHKVEENTDS